MTVNANVTPSVSISANPAGSICAGTSVEFTATANNLGGGTASFNFKVNGSSVQNGASNTYTTTTLANGDAVTVEITITGGVMTLRAQRSVVTTEKQFVYGHYTPQTSMVS